MQPDGGPRDSLRPFITRSIPKDQSINFRGEKLIIEFSEWIREKNLRQELLITPPATQYTHKITKNRLEITFEDTLVENTTYSFSFREGIEDITEGNKAVIDTLQNLPLKVAFSTGAIIDSMKVSGQVNNRLSNKVIEKAIIALYRTDDTLTLDKHKPYYYTLTDKEGNFKIENIKSGAYKIYAFLDKNSNSIYNEPEAIDFLPEVLNFSADTAHIHDLKLSLVQEDHTVPEIKSKNTTETIFQIEFNEGLKEYVVKAVNQADEDEIFYDLKKKGTTLKFYNAKKYTDTLAVQVSAIDSAGNRLDTIQRFAFTKSNENEGRGRRKQTEVSTSSPFNFEIKPAGQTGFEKTFDLTLEFEKPVALADFEKLRYLPDGDSTRIAPLIQKDSLQFYQWNSTRSVLRIAYPQFFFKEKISIIADTAAFISILQDSSRLFTKTFERKLTEDFSSIYGEVNTEKPFYILQLLSESNEVLSQLINPVRFEFNYLRPATYKLRLITDSNQNGQWDTSDWKNNVRAEEVFFPIMPNEGRLRERWDIEVLIDF